MLATAHTARANQADIGIEGLSEAPCSIIEPYEIIMHPVKAININSLMND